MGGGRGRREYGPRTKRQIDRAIERIKLDRRGKSLTSDLKPDSRGNSRARIRGWTAMIGPGEQDRPVMGSVLICFY